MKNKALSAAAKKGLAVRWGAPRPPCGQIRVDADAAAALRVVPERDRRRVASDAIRKAVEEYRNDLIRCGAAITIR